MSNKINVSRRMLGNVFIVIILLLVNCLTSCKKFIEVGPPTTSITEQNVFENDLTATAVVTGIYTNISGNGLDFPNLITMSKLLSLSADELGLWSGAIGYENFYFQNALYSRQIEGGVASPGGEFWNVCYGYIFNCNQVIDGVNKSGSITPAVRKQLIGETKFLRAFIYFYLVNLYGGVPLVTGIDVETNRLVKRQDSLEVYNFIISELVECKELLSSSYLNSGLNPYPGDFERIRPTTWAATALLARAYLYTEDYAKAEQEATAVINQSSLFDLPAVGLGDVFIKNSREAIWQLQPVMQGWNTIDAQWFNLSSDPIGFSITKSVFLSNSQLNTFEPGDARKEIWTGQYDTFAFPAKYKAGMNFDITPSNVAAISEYHMILRIAEQYLIRSEARLKQGNISGAVSDLNIIRTRARSVPTVAIPDPLPDLSESISESECFDAIMHERQVELFTEWGHRWLDLKRTKTIDEIMVIETPKKGGTWESADQLYPIPFEELTRNPNLVQNNGY